jgi:hypothetical protein
VNAHDRRARVPRGGDRRRLSRSGRRIDDPHVSAWYWRRLAWLFAAYAAFLSLRSLPSTLRRWFEPRLRA